MNKVNRTCPICGIDHGSLRECRFYDYVAMLPGREAKHPIVSGGKLNTVIICGSETCRNKAMDIRRKELSH